jgi:hypothetical protein
MKRRVFTYALCVGTLAGCGGGTRDPQPAARRPEPPVRQGTPLSLQMLRTEAQMKKYPFFNLLHFERDADAVFVRAEASSSALDPARNHTGSASLRLQPGTTSATVKLASLHSGREWPGPWTLVGAYLYSEQKQRLTAAFEIDGQALEKYTVELPANQWTPVLLDVLASLQGRSTSNIGALRFTFDPPPASPLWVDDVVEIDNTTTHVTTPTFAVQERGFRYVVERPGRFVVRLKTPEAAQGGWVLREANPTRAVFTTADKLKFHVVYSDGRQIEDGKLRMLYAAGTEDEFAVRSHQEPALVKVTPETGRLDRNTPGDADNDGYCEMTGAYQIVASGPRVQCLITPRTPAVTRPVLEIRDLPAGKALVTMEGLLVERHTRTPDGRLLIELPGALQRETAVTVRISQ